MSYRKILLKEDGSKFLAIHANNSKKEFGIGGKDADSNYFFVSVSRESMIEFRNKLDEALEEVIKDDSSL